MACNCLHGTARIDANGNCVCDDMENTKENCTGVWIEGLGCTGGYKGGGVLDDSVSIVKPLKRKTLLDTIIEGAKDPVLVDDSGMRGVESGGLLDFIKANPLLIGGGAAILIYFLFFRDGLGAADRTITSVTKYLPSK